MAWSADFQLDDVLRRCPGLERAEWVLPQRPRPFPILATLVAGPTELLPYPPESRNYVHVEWTPLYAGRACTSDITYEKRSSPTVPQEARERVLRVGGLLELIGWGGAPPASGLPSGATQGLLQVSTPPQRPMSLSRILAHGSWAGGGFISQHLPRLSRRINDSMPIWSPEDEEPRATDMGIFDGGISENIGIMSLLRRGVRRVVMILNTVHPLAPRERWDPFARVATLGEPGTLGRNGTNDPQAAQFPAPPGPEDICSSLAALFGVVSDPATQQAWCFRRNHVFPREGLAPLAATLQEAQERGKGAVATTELTTVANEFWGIRAGLRVKVTVAYLGQMRHWQQRLPPETRNFLTSRLNGFPHLHSDHPLGNAGANLLAAHTAAAIRWNEAELADIIGAI